MTATLDPVPTSTEAQSQQDGARPAPVVDDPSDWVDHATAMPPPKGPLPVASSVVLELQGVKSIGKGDFFVFQTLAAFVLTMGSAWRDAQAIVRSVRHMRGDDVVDKNEYLIITCDLALNAGGEQEEYLRFHVRTDKAAGSAQQGGKKPKRNLMDGMKTMEQLFEKDVAVILAIDDNLDTPQMARYLGAGETLLGEYKPKDQITLKDVLDLFDEASREIANFELYSLNCHSLCRLVMMRLAFSVKTILTASSQSGSKGVDNEIPPFGSLYQLDSGPSQRFILFIYDSADDEKLAQAVILDKTTSETTVYNTKQDDLSELFSVVTGAAGRKALDLSRDLVETISFTWFLNNMEVFKQSIDRAYTNIIAPEAEDSIKSSKGSETWPGDGKKVDLESAQTLVS